MFSAQLLRSLCVGILIGVAAASFFVFSNGYFLGILALVLSILIIWPRERWAWLAVMGCWGVMIGAIRMQTVRVWWQEQQASIVAGDLSGEAHVVGEWSMNGTRFTVPIAWERCEARECPSGHTLLIVSHRSVWLPGQMLRVHCALARPSRLRADFDYPLYLAKEKVTSLCTASQVELGERALPWSSEIFALRMRWEESLARAIPEPEAGLIAGILFGGSDRLPTDIQQAFARTGLTHIVAVSGYNVLIVAEGLLWLGILLGLWRRQAFWLALVGIGIFVIGTGAGASVVRASIMGALAFVALQVGRLSSGIWLVLFAAAGMLVYNPFLLRYDLGFQLSFLATLVLVVGLARFRAREVLVQAWWWPVMEIGLATLGIELVVGPLLLSTFGYISLVSIPANILILPVVPLAMLIGFLVVLVGLFVPPMLNIFAWLAYFLTGYMLWVVEFCAHFSWATLQWRITSWQIVLWYTGLIGVFLWKQRHVWRNTGDGGRSEDSVSS